MTTGNKTNSGMKMPLEIRKKEKNMNTRKGAIIVGLLLCFCMALAAPQGAMAATAACTGIGNTATVNFNVGGAAQAPVSSGTNTIIVGNKVDLTVVTTNASPGPSVVPNQVDVLLTYTITNNGNANQKFGLTAVQLASGSTTTVFGNQTVTDAFNAASFAEGDATGAAMTMTPTVASGATYTVTIRATMPDTTVLPTPGSDGWYAVYSMRARAYKVDGSTPEILGVSGIDSSFGTCNADIVLGDAAGPDDLVAGTNPDGTHSARSAYHVVLNSLNVTKSSIVYSDPINGAGAGAKAIPGAIMEYLVVLTNPGGTNATGVTITDILPVATLAPVTAAWTSATAGGGSGCAGQARVNIASGGWVCLTGGIGDSSWSGQTLTATVNTLVSGTTATVVYQATIK